MLQSYHKKVDISCQALKPGDFKVGMPVFFNQKRTNVVHSFRLFNLGVIHEIRRHRNSVAPRTLILRCTERNKIITRALRPEDTLIINTQGDIGLISDADLKGLGIRIIHMLLKFIRCLYFCKLF